MSKKIKVLIVVAALIAVFAVGAYFVRIYFSGKLYIQVTQHFSQQTGRTAEQHRMWSMVTAF